MHLVVRADASPKLGAGHGKRCLTLSTALRKEFAKYSITLQLTLACTKDASMHVNDFQQAGFNIVEIESTQSDIHQLQGDIYLIDHYEIDFHVEDKLSDLGAFIIVIDDLANRKHNCDVLIDVNLTPNYTSRYNSLLPQHSMKLIGPQYALLREEFYTLSDKTLNKGTPNLFVCFGGSDPTNMTSLALDALDELKDLDFTADIVIGSEHGYKSEIIKRTCEKQNITLHVNCNNIADLMHNATLMIGAGGGMHWERCISNLPGIIITVADNQIDATRCLADMNACEYLGHTGSVTSLQLLEAVKRTVAAHHKGNAEQHGFSDIVPKNGGARLVSQQVVQRIMQ